LIGKYYLKALANINSDVVPAGEFLYEGLDLVEPGTLVIAISQSGESTDVIRAVRMAKRRGAAILGIINRLGTTLMRESNIYLPVGAGPEMAVPATKTFTATLSILLQLVSMVSDKLEWAQSGINTVIKLIANNLDSINKRANEIAKEIKDSVGAYVISGGPIGMPLALEAALKFKEAAQLHAEAYNFRELKHGPITLVSREFPVIAILPGGDIDVDMETVITEVWYRGGTVITIGNKYGRKLGDYFLTLNNSIDPLLIPIAYAPIIQLLAYNLGVIRGIDVDNPRHLTKVVTT
jgi:glucosamine--fructose-6-phosphate aminotransferase (isomerizing)